MVLAWFPITSSWNTACYIRGQIHGIGRGVPNVLILVAEKRMGAYLFTNIETGFTPTTMLNFPIPRSCENVSAIVSIAIFCQNTSRKYRMADMEDEMK